MKKEILAPNPLAPLAAKLNLTKRKIVGPLNKISARKRYLSKMRIRGHEIPGPNRAQIYDKFHAVLNQARILTWEIHDKVADCNDPSPEKPWKQRSLDQIDLLVVHCTDSDIWSCEQVSEYDMSEKNHITPGHPLPGITYQMFVSKDGDTILASNLKNITWHAGGYNSHSVGIAIPYRATGAKTPPPSPIMRGLVRTLTILALRFKLNPYYAIKGHRELLGTGFRFVKGHKVLRKTCPGLLIDLDNLRFQVAIEMQKILARVSSTNSEMVTHDQLIDRKLYTGALDGVVGPKTKEAIRLFYSESLDLLLTSNDAKKFIGDEWVSDRHSYKYNIFDDNE